MYKINQVTLPIDFSKDNLKTYLAKKIKCDESNITYAKLNKLSIDARDKSDIVYKASIIFDTKSQFNVKKYKNVEICDGATYNVDKWKTHRSVLIVGSGPSGLFAGLRLAESGAKVTIIERGYEMAKRKVAVDKMMREGILDTTSNIQFGEGGAGTFSDGKLNTGIKSPHISTVLETFHKFGADECITYDARPHIGTDVLSKVIVRMREYMKSLGVQFLFEHKLVGLEFNNNKLRGGIVLSGDETKIIESDYIVLAIGHSSRDTVRMLYDTDIKFKQKPFSMGFRIEHLQKDINMAQYGNSEASKLLPPADYHIVEHVGDRVVYSFCMCPGGVVVPASSEEGAVVTNGMSYNSRDGVNSNSALLVNVNTTDFPDSHPLAGISLQEKYERFAYSKTGSYSAVVQRVGDFLLGRPTTRLGKVKPTYTPNVVLGSVEDMLPEYIIKSIRQALPSIGKRLKGFDDPDAIFTGVETRSSAPYQMERGMDMQTSIEDVFAIGEGAGFAGGIVSSAVEGLKCADILISKNN